jgi:hypothetical protein
MQNTNKLNIASDVSPIYTQLCHDSQQQRESQATHTTTSNQQTIQERNPTSHGPPLMCPIPHTLFKANIPHKRYAKPSKARNSTTHGIPESDTQLLKVSCPYLAVSSNSGEGNLQASLLYVLQHIAALKHIHGYTFPTRSAV